MSEKPSQLVTVAREWLERARCPDCSGSGWVVDFGAEGPFREGCEWCYVKYLVLSPIPEQTKAASQADPPVASLGGLSGASQLEGAAPDGMPAEGPQ